MENTNVLSVMTMIGYSNTIIIQSSEKVLFCGTVKDVPKKFHNKIVKNISFEEVGSFVFIEDFIDEDEIDPNKEYYFCVHNSSGDGHSWGYMKMNLKQAEFVNSVADESNWKRVTEDDWTGHTWVDTNDFIPVEEFEDE